jgi:hypothetical protein
MKRTVACLVIPQSCLAEDPAVIFLLSHNQMGTDRKQDTGNKIELARGVCVGGSNSATPPHMHLLLFYREGVGKESFTDEDNFEVSQKSHSALWYEPKT